MMPSITYSWERIGAPSGGAVTDLAVSPDFLDDQTVFAATMAGLFRSPDAGQSWRRVGAPLTGLSLTAVAISPDFARDGLVLVASLEGGLLRVTRDGATWVAGDFQGRAVQVTALAMSPHFARDGLAFAATIAGGVFRSRDRGVTWEPSSFGLLDLDVSALAIAPDFARDETLFAATATGLFRSPNGGRAWREAPFPAEAAPLQCLAISPAFSADGALFAGTEAAGLFRSGDRGVTWHRASPPLGDACINAIALSPGFADDGLALIATEAAIYVSRDAGKRWSPCVEASGALCLAMTPPSPADGPVLVGLSREGILRSSGGMADWRQANTGLAGHRLTGLTLSPTMMSDHWLVAFGVGEGVLGSGDGGATWIDVSEGLPSLHVTAVAFGAGPGGDLHLYTALPEGIWERPWANGAWTQVSDRPTRLLVPSSAVTGEGGLLAVGTDGSVWTYHGAPRQATPVSVPWGQEEILALATSPAFEHDGRVFAATREASAARVRIWQGSIPGGWQPVMAYQSAYPHATITVPASLPWTGVWYASIGEQFYGPLGLARDARGVERFPTGYPLTAERPAILTLAALPGPSPARVLAVTTRGLFLLAEGNREWRMVADEEASAAVVALAPMPRAANGAVYALHMGGWLWRGQPLMDER